MPELLSRSTDTASTVDNPLEPRNDGFAISDNTDEQASTRTVSVPASDEPQQRRQRRARRPKPSAVELLFFVATPVLHAIPWLVDGAPWCGLIAIACGLYLVTRRSLVASFAATWLWGIAAIGAAFYWSPGAMAYTLSSGYGLGFVVALPLILWDGLRLALGYWLAARITNDVRSIWLPAALTTMALEFAMPGVFPWRLGFMLLPWPWFTQAVDIFGPAWPTFVAFAIAGMLVCLTVLVWKRLPHGSHDLATHAGPGRFNRVAWAATPIVGLSLAYGFWAMYHWQTQIDSAPETRIAMVQVDPSFTESLEQSQQLTMAAAHDVDLICWPESSGGSYELALDELSDRRRVFMASREPVRGLQPWTSPTCELLLGGKNYVGNRDEPNELYVTAMLINEQQRITGRYNKRFLMPFGEYVPLEHTVPGLADLFDMAEYITPGLEPQVLHSETGARLGTMLCYEDMVPQAAREMTLAGANVLVSLINGSAFESPHTLSQHRLLSQLRSLECRRYFLRCAATGETCLISPMGEVVSRLPLQENGVLKASVPLLEGTTLYNRFPWAGVMLCFVGLGLAVARRKKLQSHERTK